MSEVAYQQRTNSLVNVYKIKLESLIACCLANENALEKPLGIIMKLYVPRNYPQA